MSLANSIDDPINDGRIFEINGNIRKAVHITPAEAALMQQIFVPKKSAYYRKCM